MDWLLKIQGRFLTKSDVAEIKNFLRSIQNGIDLILWIKGTGMFWKKENAENIIFLRSLVLTGKLKTACKKTCSIVKNMFNSNKLDALPMAF